MRASLVLQLENDPIEFIRWLESYGIGPVVRPKRNVRTVEVLLPEGRPLG